MSAYVKEFLLTHVVEDVSCIDGEELYDSPVEEHFNVPWHFKIDREDGFLGLYLAIPHASFRGTDWSIKTGFELKIKSVAGKIFAEKFEQSFGHDDRGCWGKPEFIKWEKMEKDYMVDGKIIVEAHVKILEMNGFEKKKLKCFDESMKAFSDVVMVVKDEKFYVSKLFLASQSTHFEAMFLRKFRESNQNEIKLKYIDPEDFQNFLESLYGEPAIDDDTVEGILHLADMYDAKVIIKKCEEFLTEKSEKTLKEKLQTASKYRLKQLKSNCFLNIKTAEDVKSVLPGNLGELDPDVSNFLLHKMVSLHNGKPSVAYRQAMRMSGK